MHNDLQPPRFLLDRMLVRLGKYLRIIGVDATWHLDLPLPFLLARANAEGRIFVTRNLHLADVRPQPTRVCLLADSEPVAQFQRLVAEFGLDPQALLFSRCIRCNVALDTVTEKESIRDRVHPNVFARHEHFFIFPLCGTVFWKGSHVRNSCRKLRLPSAEELHA